MIHRTLAMNRNTLVATASLWLVSIAGAYFLGRQGEPAQVSGSSSSSQGRATAASGAAGTGTNGAVVLNPSGAPWAGNNRGPADATTRDQALAGLRAALANPNAIERTQGFLASLEGLDNEGMKEALELIRAQDEPMGTRWQTMLLMYAWGRKDPEAALAFNKESGNDRGNFAVLSSWAEVAPDRAIAWAQANAPVDENGQPQENWSMVGVVHGLARTDIGKAAQAVEAMNFGRARGDAIDTVLDRLWRNNPQAAQDWVKTIGDERLRGGVAERVANRMADSDPAKAADWVTRLPDPSSKARAAGSIIERWSENDPNAAGEWLNTHFPAGEASDVPRERFAYSIDNRDPQSSLAWAATITDQRRRDETITRIARDWLRRDAQNARAILQQTPNLPEAVVSRLNR